MVRRGVKIGIIVGVVILIILGIVAAIFYSTNNKTVYRVNAVEKTDFTVADFVDNSELQFFKNNTFHLQIVHKEKGLSLCAVGTYTLKDKTYQLTFVQAYARDNDGNIVDYTAHANEITCVRTGSRIKITDHKGQTFYFG